MSGLNKHSAGQPTWMVVFVTYNLPEAHIVAGRLQHEGIPAMINHAIGSSAIGIHIGRMGEVKVLVHPQNYEHALDILEPDDDVFDELPDATDDIIYDWDEDEWDDHDDK